jgi:hypothetical protein
MIPYDAPHHYGYSPVIATTSPPDHYKPCRAGYWYNAKTDVLWLFNPPVPQSMNPSKRSMRVPWHKVDLTYARYGNLEYYMGLLRVCRDKARIMGYEHLPSIGVKVQCLTTGPRVRK